MKYNFKSEKMTNHLIKWIRDWFLMNGPKSNVIIGISGGKDSTVVAKLCVEALGKDRVIGVMLPNGEQHDIDVAKEVCEYLGIKYYTWNIKEIFDSFTNTYTLDNKEASEQSIINLAPRIRMAALRFITQSNDGRLVNTSNLSEDWVGYATIDGDSAGDFSPLSFLTVTEVKQIGSYLGIPNKFIEKIPEDGLTGVSDEEKLGLKYEDIDTYIRVTNSCQLDICQKIEEKFKKNLFKILATRGITKFSPPLDCIFDYDEDRFENVYYEIEFLCKYHYSALPPCLRFDPRSVLQNI